LGLENTHFDNPHGLDSEQHYTTAHDLALIARALLAHPTLRAICATRKITIPGAEENQVRVLVNHNKMLRTYEGAVGVKTGFTKRSGRCLVSAAERNGLTLIAVTLSAPDDWNDHARMLDAGFESYERVSLCGEDGFEALLPVTGGREQYVLVRNAANVSLTLPRERGAMLCTIELPRFAFADVAAGDAVGRLVFRCDLDGDGKAEKLADIPLSTSYAVPRRQKQPQWKRLWAWIFGIIRK
jgi:D-alanyl-D-alanine carboxypeptidase/D-alanyl-D-alanine carboxypeptidase (penicillin-binding protein 5/6)